MLWLQESTVVKILHYQRLLHRAALVLCGRLRDFISKKLSVGDLLEKVKITNKKVNFLIFFEHIGKMYYGYLEYILYGYINLYIWVWFSLRHHWPFFIIYYRLVFLTGMSIYTKTRRLYLFSFSLINPQ